MKFNRIWLTILLGSFVALLVTSCSPTAANEVSAQQLTAPNSTITVVGHGKAFGEPNQAQVVLGVEIFDRDVTKATQENEATIKRVMAVLAEHGVALEDIQTVNFGLWAEQIYGDRGPEGIAGYRVTNQINVTVRQVSKLGDILAAVIEAGANSIHSVSFSVTDVEKLEAEARESAMVDARQRAQSLATLAGVTLGEIKVISEVMGSPIGPLAVGGGGSSMAEIAAPSIALGQLSHQVQIQVTFAIE